MQPRIILIACAALLTGGIFAVVVEYDLQREAIINDYARICRDGSSCPLMVSPYWNAPMATGWAMIGIGLAVGLGYYYVRAIYPKVKSAKA